MESGLLIDQDLNERLEQSLPAFSNVVNKLEEPQIHRSRSDRDRAGIGLGPSYAVEPAG